MLRSSSSSSAIAAAPGALAIDGGARAHQLLGYFLAADLADELLAHIDAPLPGSVVALDGADVPVLRVKNSPPLSPPPRHRLCRAFRPQPGGHARRGGEQQQDRGRVEQRRDR